MASMLHYTQTEMRKDMWLPYGDEKKMKKELHHCSAEAAQS